MELSTAIRLIENGIAKTRAPQTWADLGAGKGLFTKALATLLPKQSIVHAIDKDSASLKAIDHTLNEVTIELVHSDISNSTIKGGPFDGFLMANSLHYIRDQSALLKQLASQLTPNGRLVIIEYDVNTSNPWVPYPVSYEKLKKLAAHCGLIAIKRLGETPSVYSRADVYSAELCQNKV